MNEIFITEEIPVPEAIGQALMQVLDLIDRIDSKEELDQAVWTEDQMFLAIHRKLVDKRIYFSPANRRR